MRIFSLYFYLAFFTGSFVLSIVLTPIVRKIALSIGQVAVPKDSRWHKKRTALMGGVSIFFSTMAMWILGERLVEHNILRMAYFPLVLCSSGIFLLGLVDDIVSMDPQHKLAAQLMITSILIVFGFKLDWAGPKTANLFLSVIWIVGITNAFNLLDNMDGLAAGVALIASIFLFLTHYLSPDMSPSAGVVLFLTAAYMGSLLGFLVYNFNPASIFMGDGGSLFIGFVMACLNMIGAPERNGAGSIVHLLSVIAIPIFIVFIPILDTGFVSVMRKLFRRPISQGGRDHSSHRMVAIGFSEKKAVLVLYGFSVASGLIALAINYLSIGATLVIIVLYLLFVIFFWIYLARVKVYEEDSILVKNGLGAFTPILVEITYRRRLFEVLLDFVLISVAYYASYLLRFEGPVYYLIGDNFKFFLNSLPILVACQIFCFYIFGIYRGIWQSTGLRDLINYMKAITSGTVLSMLILLFIYRFYSFSRVVFIIYWILMLLLISLSRLSFRLVDEGLIRAKQKGRPALIYGAGLGGQMIMREIENNRELGLSILGFIDDDPQKQKSKIMGYPVLGGMKDLEKIIKENNIQEIIVSFKKDGEEKKKEVRDLCRKMNAGIEVKQIRLMIS